MTPDPEGQFKPDVDATESDDVSERTIAMAVTYAAIVLAVDQPCDRSEGPAALRQVLADGPLLQRIAKHRGALGAVLLLEEYRSRKSHDANRFGPIAPQATDLSRDGYEFQHHLLAMQVERFERGEIDLSLAAGFLRALPFNRREWVWRIYSDVYAMPAAINALVAFLAYFPGPQALSRVDADLSELGRVVFMLAYDMFHDPGHLHLGARLLWCAAILVNDAGARDRLLRPTFDRYLRDSGAAANDGDTSMFVRAIGHRVGP